MMTEPGTVLGEEEEAFVARRAVEERRRMAETSCMVRAVHEELAEDYEERLRAAAAETAAFAAIIARIEEATTPPE